MATKKDVPKEAAAPTPEAPNVRRRLRGVVSSAKMEKTIAVSLHRLVMHPIVEKHLRRTTVLKAHDEKREAKEGDEVEIEETRPLSKTKRWRLVRIVRRGPGEGGVEAERGVEAESQHRRKAKAEEKATRQTARPADEPAEEDKP